MYQCYGSKYLYIEFGSGSRIFFNLDPDPNIEFYIVNFEKKFWRVKSFYKKITFLNCKKIMALEELFCLQSYAFSPFATNISYFFLFLRKVKCSMFSLYSFYVLVQSKLHFTDTVSVYLWVKALVCVRRLFQGLFYDQSRPVQVGQVI